MLSEEVEDHGSSVETDRVKRWKVSVVQIRLCARPVVSIHRIVDELDEPSGSVVRLAKLVENSVFGECRGPILRTKLVSRSPFIDPMSDAWQTLVFPLSAVVVDDVVGPTMKCHHRDVGTPGITRNCYGVRIARQRIDVVRSRDWSERRDPSRQRWMAGHEVHKTATIRLASRVNFVQANAVLPLHRVEDRGRKGRIIRCYTRNTLPRILFYEPWSLLKDATHLDSLGIDDEGVIVEIRESQTVELKLLSRVLVATMVGKDQGRWAARLVRRRYKNEI